MTSAVLTRVQLAGDRPKRSDPTPTEIVEDTEPPQAAIPERGWPWWQVALGWGDER